MFSERTLVLIKPNTVKRGLAGKIISRFEDKGFTIEGMKLLSMSRAMAEDLYSPHKGKDFYERTISFMTSSPIIAMVIVGYDAVAQVRHMIGATDPREAAPGTIRGDMAQRIEMNCVHGSDSHESAAREIPIFFTEAEIHTFKRFVDH